MLTSHCRAVDPPEITWADLRRVVDRFGAEAGEWGGVPIPMDHVKLVMEPRYPFPGLHGAKLKRADEPALTTPKDDAYTMLNEWFCYRSHRHVYVCREANGKSRVYFLPEGAGQRLTFWLNTLGVAAGHAWDIATEERANEKLKSLVTEHAYHCYRLVGGFLETSRRSGVTYLFRKLRPTLALRPNSRGMMEVIAVLCMHPLGYYAESWAGVMCPTDDVVAHLMLMRGDEHRFWKNSNHHPMSAASAGI
jgi:hypothetical protein